ncbi:LOW QUALITY PROTEIN: hypothetical protein ACHAXM_001911 [Skeletonema potamos]
MMVRLPMVGFGSDWSLAANAESYLVRTLKVFTNAQTPVTSTSSTSVSSTTATTTSTTTMIQTSSPTPAPTNASTDQSTSPPSAASTPPPSQSPNRQPTSQPATPPTPNPTPQPTQQNPNTTPQPTEPNPSNSDPVKSLIPDANGYDLVYALDIPVNPAYKLAKPLYSVGNHQSFSTFTRIGYYLELDDKYVWVSMDSFVTDAHWRPLFASIVW